MFYIDYLYKMCQPLLVHGDNMNLIKLSNRLFTVASLIDKGSYILDIGTDHAFLPCYLVQNDIAIKGIASDINIGPLENAKKTIELCGLSEKIETVLSNGFENIDINLVDTVIICGMGGDLIHDILEKGDITLLQKKKIIVQPQSHFEKVRQFFIDNHFEIIEEKYVSDKGKDYMCLACVFNENIVYDSYFAYYGKKPKQINDIYLRVINKQIENYQTKIKFDNENSEFYSLIIKKLKENKGESND